ncbi:alkaline phosphatase family protein [bacterium]|nr:alkaline phosphatase family protein [FCB group bacterium]MBL7192302.1 alkaline phosphatase family protein [bacterium]
MKIILDYINLLSNNRAKFLFTILFTIVLILSLSSDASAYIGPGAGFAFLYSFFIIFLILFIAPLFALVWPIWYLFHKIKTGGGTKNARVKRVVILGLDGLDPDIADDLMVKGKLPNFKKLAEFGCFHKLGTSMPSVSPAAWSSFQTGCSPAKHNIFDFLDRDRSTYAPIISSAYIGGNTKYWKIGKFKIPRGKPVVRLLRKSKPFWNILGEHGVFSTVLRVPITFPPEKFFGVSLSAMCTPDLKGSQGTFTAYSTTPADEEHTGGVRIPVEWNSNTIDTYIPGPINSLSEKGEEMRLPLKIIKHNGKIELKVNGGSYKLKQGEFSDWINLTFKAGMGVKAAGICKFYLTQLEPELTLYMSPINIDPEKPSLPISHPIFYSVYLAKLLGAYATLGLAEDTWALNEGVLDDKAFYELTWMIDEERRKMFKNALKRTKKGVVICVFDASDRIQHMFWRCRETNHPANRNGKPQLDFDPVQDMYIRYDKLAGETLEAMGEDDVLMVISDHGFKSFRRCFGLNAWLKENGYLKLKEGAEGGDFFQDVDWKQTKAYGVGLGGLYLNLKGREADGIVEPGEDADRLKQELKEKLSGFVDPQNGDIAINRMIEPGETGTGPYAVNGPDLFFGFNPGYRISWGSVTGDTRGEIFSDNVKKWSGDHCVDYKLAPGVFFSNRKITADNPNLRDIGPTTLELYGIPVPGYMDGKPLMKEIR